MVIFGLGNPGPEYSGTRHNAGFQTIEKVAALKGIRLRKRCFCRYRTAVFDGNTLVEPLTYMNSSGEVFPELVRDGEQVIVVVDQMDLPPGRLRIRTKGGSAGHNGLKSIISSYGEDFIRIYIGIGRPPAGVAVPDYVLAKPSAEEVALIDKAMDQAVSAIIAIASGEDIGRVIQKANSFSPEATA